MLDFRKPKKKKKKTHQRQELLRLTLLHNQISSVGQFTKFSYPWCSAARESSTNITRSFQECYTKLVFSCDVSHLCICVSSKLGFFTAYPRIQTIQGVASKTNNHFVSEDDCCTGCRNASHCEQQSYSGVRNTFSRTIILNLLMK